MQRPKRGDPQGLHGKIDTATWQDDLEAIAIRRLRRLVANEESRGPADPKMAGGRP